MDAEPHHKDFHPPIWIAIILLLAACPTIAARAEPDRDLESLSFKYKIERERIERPMQDLERKYLAALEKLKEAAQAAGSLDTVLAAQAEIDGFREAGEASANQEVASRQAIYQRERQRLLEKRAESSRQLDLAYAESLEALVAELTRGGKLDEAQQAQKVLGSLRAAVADEPAGAPQPTIKLGTEIPLPSLKPDGCEIEATDEGIRITSKRRDGVWVKTPREFATPFRATFVARTDSTNIRLNYERGVIIFNWEANQNELRVRDPKSGKRSGLRGKGKLPTDTWQTIVWEIRDDSMSILLNGETLVQRDGDYKVLRGKLGIGPGFGSKVDLKTIAVEPL